MSPLLLPLAALLPAGPPPKLEDLSPTQKNGTVNSRASTAGLMVNMAGDARNLYVVSLNAGVWKSVNGKQWVQLANSPSCAWSIALDPTNRNHLAVGERNGLAKDMRLNRTGLWESFDAGKTWRYTLDPLSIAGCQSQAVPTVAFSPEGTLLAGTGGGIARKPRGAKVFAYPKLQPSIGLVTALAVGKRAAWARSRTHLLRSDDDGATWTARPFPAELNGVKVTFTSRGDAFALGATDDLAYTPFIPVPTPDNRNNVLYFDSKADRWFTQVLDTGNGTGLGGRRIARSFYLADEKLKDEIGARYQLFVGAGQEIHQAIGQNRDGTLKWDSAIQTRWGGPYSREPNDIHPDTWDILIPPDYDPQNPTGWVACDGGVYAPTQRPDQHWTQMWRMKWVTQNDGLNTHHAHTITVLPTVGGRSRLAYPTADNDGWFWDAKSGWLAELYMGDVNFTVGDAANPSFAVLWRNISLAMCTAFGLKPPEGAGFREYDAIMLNPLLQFDGPYAFNLVQTLKDEPLEHPLGDALMLVTPPLQVRDKDWKLQTVAGPLGKPTSGPVLIRNRAFAGSPDANVSRFQTWELFASDLPKGTQGFWVSGGHAKPTVIVVAKAERGTKLFKGHGNNTGWQEIRLDVGGTSFAALVDEPKDRLAYDNGIPPLPNADATRALEDEVEPALGSMHGPVFLNPYDPMRLFVLTRSAVLSSRDGGGTFEVDKVLTALATGSGMYPITTGNLSGNVKDVVLAGRENSMATLTHMAFLRDDPDTIVASSPFTGIFLSRDSGRSWQDLTPYLPRPLSAVPSVGIDNEAVYAVPYGRGVVRITGYRAAPHATYLQDLDPDEGDWILRTGDGKGLGRRTLRLRAWDASRRLVMDRKIATIETGVVQIPRLPKDSQVLEVAFTGDRTHAPTLTRRMVGESKWRAR